MKIGMMDSGIGGLTVLYEALRLLPDEAFLQTFVTEKGIKQTCKSSMRRIDWERSPNGKSPYVFRLDDYEMLINSGMNFGRKFDMDVDKEIINKIYNDFIKHLR